ncbi:MAG: glycosyltransferase [Planctomycetota bacterium]|nr:glycosyltransferase [Planctomycetota bacterium]
MKIGVLTSLFPSEVRPFEGIFAERRWRGMAERGHDVTIVQPTPRVPWPLAKLAPRRFGDLAGRPRIEQRGPLEVRRPRYLHATGLSGFSAARFAAAGWAELLAAGKPDVVVCDYAWPAAEVVPLAKAARVPVVISGRGSDVLAVAEDPSLRPRLAADLAAAGAWIGVSDDLVASMSELAAEGGLALGSGRSALVPNGVDGELFQPVDEGRRTALRAELGWQEGEVIVLVVGHLIPRKDPLLALSAFRSFLSQLNHKNSGAPPEARLVFVGEGELEARLRATIAEGPQGAPGTFRVDLVGALQPTELAKRYAAADLLLLTSSREGRPNVVLEAFASGLPVVATRAGGTPELLEGTRCRPVNSRYPTDLAKLMVHYVERRPEAARLVERIQPLTWDAGLATLEAFLEEATQR